VKVGIPAGIQGSLFSFSNVMIQSAILRMNSILSPGSVYEPVVEGNAAVSNLNNFIYTATNSVHQASVAFTSQNVGAGKYDRIKYVMINCYAITTIIALVLSFIVILFNHQLLALYGINDGEGIHGIAYKTAVIKLWYETLPCFLCAIMDVGCGVLRGLGRSLTSTIISLIGACALRVVWLLTVFEHFLTLESIYVSYPVSWIITGFTALVFVIILLSKQRKGEIEEKKL
jgi:Na+-driven multidrug efflux pump